ncbi:MAG: hypothetical protein KME15_19945 [Drouetiella hepatica Uher 2000/2452]|jgi:hypothetical protein|uniref:Uncharacterized protein n=1 Tax=Drouetiella hepatica Uher 2000/2452 TaxID=904376 RepID=A0A951QFF6_9CYAN|nr:hypothetical protein [Drouetiella hepatica Uher 2000/2452]
MQPFSVTLRDKTYTASDPTSREMRVLASVFFKGESERDRIQSLMDSISGSNPFEFDLNDPNDLQRATVVLIVRMDSPAVQASLAHVLRSLFPDLPESLVNHRLIYAPNGEQEVKTVWKLDDDEAPALVLEALKHLQAEHDLQNEQDAKLWTEKAEPQGFAVAAKPKRTRKLKAA